MTFPSGLTAAPLSRIARTGRRLSLAGGAMGLLGLAGWLFEAHLVTTFVAGRPAMMPNTAVALAALGLAAVLTPLDPASRWRRLTSGALSTFVLVMALATGAQYVVGTDAGIDRALIEVPGGVFPGRPSPVTLATLCLLALASLGAPRAGIAGARATQALSLSAAFLA